MDAVILIRSQERYEWRDKTILFSSPHINQGLVGSTLVAEQAVWHRLRRFWQICHISHEGNKQEPRSNKETIYHTCTHTFKHAHTHVKTVYMCVRLCIYILKIDKNVLFTFANRNISRHGSVLGCGAFLVVHIYLCFPNTTRLRHCRRPFIHRQ